MKMMLKGASELKASLQRQFKAVEAANLLKKTVALTNELKEVTPIDTGEARSGWVAAKTPEGYAVSNDVEHVKFLNQGSSQQAPAHFVEATALKYGVPVGAIVESK